MFQMALMAAASLVCYYIPPFKSILGSPIMLALSLVAVVAWFVLLWHRPEVRKASPLNYMVLLVGTIALACFAGSFTSNYKGAFYICEMLVKACAFTGIWGGAYFAKSSTNREYLIRKLMTGALVGFFAAIVLMMFAMSSYKKDVTSGTVVMAMISYILTSMYVGYVSVFVVLPGMAEDPTDFIWGVMRVWMHIFIIIWAMLKIAFYWVRSLCGGAAYSEQTDQA